MKTYIVNMTNRRSVIHPGMTYAKGFALYVEDLGFLSLDGRNVYIPCGGRKAIRSIIDGGLDNPGYSFIYP